MQNRHGAVRSIVRRQIKESSYMLAQVDALDDASLKAAITFVQELGLPIDTVDREEVVEDVRELLRKYGRGILRSSLYHAR